MIKVFKNQQAEQNLLSSYDHLLTLWSVSTEEADISTCYGTTHVIFCGNPDSPPLVLFHGVGDNSALMWFYNAASLAKHYRLIAIDTMGGPGKSVPNARYDATFTQVKWLDDVFDGLGLSAFFLGGVSNGAYMAQCYAIARPEKVLKVICMSGGPAVLTKKSSLWKTMSIFLPEALFPTDKNVMKLIKKLSGDNVEKFISNTDLMEHWKLLLRGFNTMSMSFHKITGFTPDELSCLSGKSLFLIGTKDRIAYSEGLEAVLKEYKLDYKLFEGAGHAINHEISEQINSEIIDYLNR